MRTLKHMAINAMLALFTLALLGVGTEFALRLLLPLPETHVPGERFNEDRTGFRPGTTWTIIEPEFVERISINSLGVRDTEIDPAKPVIIFLGDSQTFGTGVNQGERFSDLVRQALVKGCRKEAYQVLNVAMPGADTHSELSMLQRLMHNHDLRPLKIFLCITGNDHQANHAALTAKRVESRLAHDMEMNANSSAPHPFWQWVKSVRYSSRLVVFVLQRLEQFQWFRDLYTELKHRLGAGEINQAGWIYLDSPVLDQWLAATEYYLEQLNAVGPTSVVLIPDRYRYDSALREKAREHLVLTGKNPEQIDFSAESAKISTMCDRLNVPFLDPADVFANHENSSKLHYAINGHATPAGHELTAQFLLQHSTFLREALYSCGGASLD
ncbi:hypothetical protein GKC30_13005 [Pseudodesulfovibrio sp. F-1]|uniref:SGNH hydrolase-type esterase domain-containing protein n=1 Tax=Pseudodesulfovibrio alkaliphilus TaxID=2661613 RepID=A0A7K1KR29_9BACT|nr:GDSL-type esterase/lipase family protein [Pseudodesulfovibrio alkaliphilus]MUM78555.1 hypothetical protein [Pseudodesulfovibrio alkaliphilus]